MTILDLVRDRGMMPGMARQESETPSFVSRQVTDARRFYLELQPPPGLKLTVVCGGWERCAADYCVERRDFPFWCVELVVEGKGTLWLAGKPYELGRGSVFAYGPDVSHRITNDPADPMLKYYVDFSGQAGMDLMRGSSLAPGVCRVVEEVDASRADFEQLLETGCGSPLSAERIAALQLEILLLRLAGFAGPSSQGQEQSRQTYLRCRKFIDEHCLEVSTAEEVAERCHVSAAYLSRLFAKHGEETAYRYLLRRRMMQAAAMLDAGGRIVREVADLLGMDPFHFSRVFKRVHGLSPSDFMRRRNGA